MVLNLYLYTESCKNTQYINENFLFTHIQNFRASQKLYVIKCDIAAHASLYECGNIMCNLCITESTSLLKLIPLHCSTNAYNFCQNNIIATNILCEVSIIDLHINSFFLTVSSSIYKYMVLTGSAHERIQLYLLDSALGRIV